MNVTLYSITKYPYRNSIFLNVFLKIFKFNKKKNLCIIYSIESKSMVGIMAEGPVSKLDVLLVTKRTASSSNIENPLDPLRYYVLLRCSVWACGYTR